MFLSELFILVSGTAVLICVGLDGRQYDVYFFTLRRQMAEFLRLSLQLYVGSLNFTLDCCERKLKIVPRAE